jgi:hypothetical protein
MNVETFAGISGWDNNINFKIKIFDTIDIGNYVTLDVRLQLCFINNADPEIFQQYYKLSVGQTTPGNTEGFFNLIFKKF